LTWGWVQLAELEQAECSSERALALRRRPVLVERKWEVRLALAAWQARFVVARLAVLLVQQLA